MKRFLIRCYPAAWRARYEDEFLAVLEERPLGPFDVADILLGAIDARLRMHGHRADNVHGRGFTMSLRIGGIAAILGATLWAVAGILNLGIVANVDGAIPPGLLLTGMAVLLVALAGLSAFQARVHPRYAWAAFGLVAAGLVGFTVAGIAFLALPPRISDAFWIVFLLGTLAALAGCLLFAIVTYRTAVLSRGGAVLIGAGCFLVFVQPLMAVGLASFAIGWFALGIQAIRLDRPSTVSRPA